mgnify:CR=1 FL=1
MSTVCVVHVIDTTGQRDTLDQLHPIVSSTKAPTETNGHLPYYHRDDETFYCGFCWYC